MKIQSVLAVMMVSLIIGCKPKSQLAPTATVKDAAVSGWDKVEVNNAGEIFVNQTQFSLADLAAECKRLKQVGGGILLYTGDQPVSSNQFQILRVIVTAKIPTRRAASKSDLD